MSYYGSATSITLKPGSRTRLAQSEDVSLAIPAEFSGTAATAVVMHRGVAVGEAMTAAGSPLALSASDVTERIAGFLGEAEVVWTVDGGSRATVKSRIEVVESYYFTLAEFRASDEDEQGFRDTVRYPDANVFAARQSAHEAFESACGNRSWTRRARLYSQTWTGGLVELPDVDIDELDSVDLGGTDIGDSAELVSDCQLAIRNLYRGRLQVAYKYGIETAPEEVRDAVLKLASLTLRKSGKPENVRGEGQEGVFVSYTIATGSDGSWFGIPSVDATIERLGRRRQVIA